jgi:hypothetical protein
MANKYMKNYSISLAIKEMQIKTTLRFHITSVKLAIIKKQTTTNAGEGGVGKEPSSTVGRNVN